MGARGPAPTPTAILEMRGSWLAKTRHGEPQPPQGKPECPRHLTKPQREVWRRLCRVLSSMCVLTTVDGAQLERYCVYYLRWRECESFLAQHGLTYMLRSDDPYCYIGRKGEDGSAFVRFVEYPQVKESHRLHDALRKIEANFGLTPAARARLRTSDEAPESGDDEGKARFFRPVG